MVVRRLERECTYEEAISQVGVIIGEERTTRYGNGVMTVGVEGLSRSGKTTLADSLGNKVSGAIVIDGDKFQMGRETGMRVYTLLLESAREGGQILVDFYNDVWRYGMMREQLLNPLAEFNRSGERSRDIALRGVIDHTTKREDSAHDETYTVTRDSIVVVPAMFLRQIDDFSFMITLNITPETSVSRKLERDKTKGVKRDPATTREMVMLVEAPVMNHNLGAYKVESGITIDTNDFERVR